MGGAGSPALGDDYRLVLVNRRGFGSSPDVEGEDFDVDAADVIDVLGSGAHLVGHSYGGVVAMLAAGAHPELVRSLAVLEPPAFGLVAERADVRLFRDRVRELMARADPADFLRGFIEAVGGDPSRLPDPLPAPLVKAASVQMHGRWPWEADIAVDALAEASFPVLVVSGGHSEMFDAVCDLLEARLHAHREVIVGAGHSIPTLGEPVNAALRAHWARSDSS